MTTTLLFLLGCAPDAGESSPLPDLPGQPEGAIPGEDGEIDVWTGTWDNPMLQARALLEAGEAWKRSDVHGTRAVGEDTLYLFGAVSDVDAFLQGSPAGVLAGVILSPDGACVGTVEGLGGSTGTEVSLSGQILYVGNNEITLQDCASDEPTVASVRLDAASLKIEHREVPSEEVEAPPPPSCSSTCGSTQGYSYAGETAYSNGGSTGSGSACNGTDSYGYRYQCVQYTERVHHRTDWAGNAYTGYWSNTGLSSGTQGPYYKGLLPLGSGTGYAAPQAGDVITWSGGTYGHVAIVASVGSSSLTLYDENRSCGDQSCNLTYSTSSSVYTLGNGSGTGYCGSESMTYTVMGYLHRGWDFGGTYGLATSTTSSSTHNWYPNDATYYGSTTSGSVSDITDYITIDPGTSDPYIVSPSGLGLPAYSSTVTYGYKYLSVYIQSNCTNKSAQLFWKRTTDSGFSSTRSVSATISGSGWQTLRFSPYTSTSWSGTIDQIRIDPASSCSSGSSDTISMQSAYFSK